jgi:hypothetical protein
MHISKQLFRFGSLSVATAVAVSAVVALSGPAAAEREREEDRQVAALPKQDGQSSAIQLQPVHMSGRLQALSQTMITRSLLAALSVDKKRNIDTLAKERDAFVRVLKGLRHGDEKLGLRATEHPEILEKLARLEKEWSIFGPAVQSIIDTGRITPQNVAIVAECIEPLAEATEQLIDVYEYYATGGRTFSVLTGMVSRAEAQHALLQEMTAGYLLVAYGHKAETYRARIWAYQAQFDRILRGLIDGDRQLNLLPAPAQPLREQFEAARQSWTRLYAITKTIPQGGAIDRDCLLDITRQSRQLAATLGKAIELYKSL